MGLRQHVLLGVGFAAGVLITAPFVLTVWTSSSPVAPRPASLPVMKLSVPVAPAFPPKVPRRPAPQVAGRGTAGMPSPSPVKAAPPPAPVVVPPLQEDAPEPKPVASSEDLKRLRAEYRRMPVLRLETIMDGVRRACGSTAWQRAGWRDYRLEFALDELIYRVKRVTERPDLKLPVRFGDVPAGVAENAKNVMTATRSIKLRSATRCIFLVDGDADAGRGQGVLDTDDRQGESAVRQCQYHPGRRRPRGLRKSVPITTPEPLALDQRHLDLDPRQLKSRSLRASGRRGIFPPGLRRSSTPRFERSAI